MKMKNNHVNIMKPVEFAVQLCRLLLLCVLSVSSVLHLFIACFSVFFLLKNIKCKTLHMISNLKSLW